MFYAAPAQAWNEFGHKVVAEIASREAEAENSPAYCHTSASSADESAVSLICQQIVSASKSFWRPTELK